MNKFRVARKAYLLFFPVLFIGFMLGDCTSLWASDAKVRASLFPEVAGWKQSGEIQTFSRADLFEYIDGGADLYLKYDFQELKVVEYRNDQNASVTIEAYRHKTPVDAFGIYSQERLSSANIVEVGAQGYLEQGVLNFLAADFYVKMSSINVGPDDQKVLLAFAKKMAGNLGGKGSLPPILSSFPSEGKRKNSEKFIAGEFLGYSFFHSGFTADYELSGRKFQLFVIAGADPNDCRTMIQAYLKHAGNPQTKVEEGRYQLQDPYHGAMDFYWKGKYIWGALGLDDEPLRTRELKLFAEGLEKKR